MLKKGPLHLRFHVALGGRALSELRNDYVDRVIKRLEFPTRELNGNGVGRFLKSLPGTCRIVPIDRGLFERCSWYDEVLAACGSVERFVTYGRGVCLMRNYAAISCAHLIEGYDGQGIPTYWSCHQTNTASIALARKLGFGDERPYRWIRYEASGQTGKERKPSLEIQQS